MAKKLVEMYDDLRKRGILDEPLEIRAQWNFTYVDVWGVSSTHTVPGQVFANDDGKSRGDNAKLVPSS